MNILEKIYTLYQQSYAVSTDTRNIAPNSVFFALKGDNFNANLFAEQAIEKGAIAAIVDEPQYVTSESIILVDNVLDALQQLAHHHRKVLNIPIISLTGSNGKTTTKELIVRVLNKKFKTQATKGNLNNHIGVPLTLLSITPDYEMAVVEMGANHQKEIEMLCEIAEPDYGYITNFGKAHLEGFGGVEGVIKGKSELYEYLKAHHKEAFVNADDALQMEKTEDIQRYTFSQTEGNVIVHTVENEDDFIAVQTDSETIHTHLVGQYNFTNIAVAIAIGNYFNIDNQSIKEAIESYIPDNNRSQVIEKSGKKIIMDCYNANPSSMQVALENFAEIEGEKTVILGDMFELGVYSIAEHQRIANLAQTLKFDQIILIGKDFYKTKGNTKRFETLESFEKVMNNIHLSDKLLIKGSRGMKLEGIVGLL